MAKLKDLASAAARLLGNMNYGKAVVAINAGSAATIKTTNAIIYSIDGVLYSKAILSAQALAVPSGASAFYVQPANTTVYYVFAVNAAGTVVTIQGDYAGQALTPHGVGSGHIPDVPAGYTAFGVMKVACGSAAFTPATTALDAANITFTFYDVGVLPAANTLS